jgi:hypothetical protein
MLTVFCRNPCSTSYLFFIIGWRSLKKINSPALSIASSYLNVQVNRSYIAAYFLKLNRLVESKLFFKENGDKIDFCLGGLMFKLQLKI